ncbi:MAG TPA: hypothetical protein VMU74_00530 [Gaiellaceae bacterium]|nr:hypothetical protein [Gaiellaceae bacterium]
MKALVLLVAALVTAGVAQSARADGDPASDYLLGTKVFLPYDAKFRPKQSAELTGLIASANKAGFPIKVAVIWSAYDMGSVTSLWHKPRTYAKFLGLELGFVYKQRLLVVMANGFGFNWPKHAPAAEYALLAKIPIPSGPAGLLTAAEAAVKQLAAAGGVDVATPAHVTTPAQRNTHDREIILVAVLGALALAAGARYLIRRSR